MRHKLFVAIIAVALTIMCSLPAWSGTQQSQVDLPKPVESEFESMSRDLESMTDLFEGGQEGQPVAFNSEAAIQRGLPMQSVLLAEEMAAATNDLLSRISRALEKETQNLRVKKLRLDFSKYPVLSSYLEKATELARESPKVDDEVELSSLLAERNCGSFSRPLPSNSASWRTHTRTDPAGTLRSWGYHETPAWLRAGGGWTRAQTHKWWLCGFGTFRDHAYITSRNQIREQNYAGFTPRGEPNPELWRSGPWPYPHWPLYVYWWHEFGPGR